MGRLICLVVLVWFLYWGLVDDVARYTTYSKSLAIFVRWADVVNWFCSRRLSVADAMQGVIQRESLYRLK
jgi:acyl-ACP thioesterase